MHTISIVTAVHPPNLRFLSDTYSSLTAQKMPDGWSWEWLVQLDGDDRDEQEAARAVLPVTTDHRIKFAASRRSGPAATRTLALARATGELVKTLDSDDQLTDGSLSRDIEIMRNNPDVAWTTSAVLDISSDGAVSPHFDEDPPAGRIRSGTLYARWRNIAKQGPLHEIHAQSMSVHPATLCMRYWVLIALGGWMALPASEDTGLLLALDAVRDGWFIDEPGLLYRKWPGQASAAPAHMDETELVARRLLIEHRAEALSLLITS